LAAREVETQLYGESANQQGGSFRNGLTVLMLEHPPSFGAGQPVGFGHEPCR
jgi:hypothetical protein